MILSCYRIDEEIFRQEHKNELEREAELNRKVMVEEALPKNFEFSSLSDVNDGDLLETRKDKRLAFKKPEVYCADRCLTTGHCDVYEDFLEMSVEEVLAFCTDCVLSDDDEVSKSFSETSFILRNFELLKVWYRKPCDVPEKLFEAGFEFRP